MQDKKPTGIAPHVRACRSLPEQAREDCYLELMSIAVFKGGLNYNVVNAKWDGIRAAFHGFDAKRVARMTPADIEKVENDPRVIHNRRKIEGVVRNAQEMMLIAKEWGGLSAWLDSMPAPEARVKALHERFAFMGPTTAYYFLHYAGEDVPSPHEWAHSHATAVGGRRRSRART
jgi:3-methyladenine DNA glycosylase Tag